MIEHLVGFFRCGGKLERRFTVEITRWRLQPPAGMILTKRLVSLVPDLLPNVFPVLPSWHTPELSIGCWNKRSPQECGGGNYPLALLPFSTSCKDLLWSPCRMQVVTTLLHPRDLEMVKLASPPMGDFVLFAVFYLLNYSRMARRHTLRSVNLE